MVKAVLIVFYAAPAKAKGSHAPTHPHGPSANFANKGGINCPLQTVHKKNNGFVLFTISQPNMNKITIWGRDFLGFPREFCAGMKQRLPESLYVAITEVERRSKGGSFQTVEKPILSQRSVYFTEWEVIQGERVILHGLLLRTNLAA